MLAWVYTFFFYPFSFFLHLNLFLLWLFSWPTAIVLFLFPHCRCFWTATCCAKTVFAFARPTPIKYSSMPLFFTVVFYLRKLAKYGKLLFWAFRSKLCQSALTCISVLSAKCADSFSKSSVIFHKNLF